MTAPKRPEDKLKVGRPSKYDPAYCEEVVTFCAQGYSLTAFAGHIGVARDTISGWGEQYPEFSAAIKRAKAAACLSFEQDAARVRQRGGGPGTSTMIIFGLKNMGSDDWRDVQRHEIGKPGDFGQMTDEELAAFVARQSAELGER